MAPFQSGGWFFHIYSGLKLPETCTQQESRGGGRFHNQDQGEKKEEVTLDTKLQQTQRMAKTRDYCRSQSLEVTSHQASAQRAGLDLLSSQGAPLQWSSGAQLDVVSVVTQPPPCHFYLPPHPGTHLSLTGLHFAQTWVSVCLSLLWTFCLLCESMVWTLPLWWEHYLGVKWEEKSRSSP